MAKKKTAVWPPVRRILKMTLEMEDERGTMIEIESNECERVIEGTYSTITPDQRQSAATAFKAASDAINKRQS